jgi:hypothetical protein
MLYLMVHTVSAGTMTPSLQVMNRYDLGTSPFPLPLGGPGLYEIGVFFRAQKDPATEKGWLSAAFAVGVDNFFGSNLTLESAIGWFPNTQTTDTNGPAIGGSKAVFQTNVDAGVPNDLQGVIAAIESALIAGAAQGGNANELRNELGTANAPNTAGYKNPLDGGAPTPATGNPSYLGSFFVRWNGLGIGRVNLNSFQYAFSLLNGTPTNALDDSPGPTTTVPGIAASVIITPEPAAGVTLAIGLLSIAGMRCRKQTFV